MPTGQPDASNALTEVPHDSSLPQVDKSHTVSQVLKANSPLIKGISTGPFRLH